MRLVWIGHAVWDVLAIADQAGRSVRDELEAADPGNDAAELMLAVIEVEVPLNGLPRSKKKCRDLGNEIYEFKEWGIRVLWFYDAGDPKRRRRIICTHSTPKMSKKEFQSEIKKAQRIRKEYMAAKANGQLIVPKKPEV